MSEESNTTNNPPRQNGSSLPPIDENVAKHLKANGIPGRIFEGMAGIGWFANQSSPLTAESTLEDIHAFVSVAEDGTHGIFNLPHVLEFADSLLDEIEEIELTIQGVDGNEIPIIVNKPKGTHPKQAILFLHGGAMAFLSSRAGTYRAWSRLLAKDGLLVASVDFRNSSGNGARAPFPAGLNDCVSALQWLGNQEDIEEITLHGESGGGNLTLATCVRAAKKGIAKNKIKGAVPWAPFIAGPAHWSKWESAEFPSLRDNSGSGFPASELIHYARAYTPNKEDWENGEAWPIFMTEEEINLLPPVAIHTEDLDMLRDEGIAFSKRLAKAGKLDSHLNHIGNTHALHVYTPIFKATDIMKQAAKSVTAFALRKH
ncbi:MAG TPA: hypothetical protein DCR93_12705 [Cytophagales bacterium]|nr:hypothetical protein [Cytophagales bacterium]HAP60306.1 hypothetical protein [Cytophagales bacterium]